MRQAFDDSARSQVAEVEAKLCTYCERYLPLDQFRLHFKGKNKRHAECRECRNSIAAERRAAERTGKVQEFLVSLRRAKSERKRDLVFALFIAKLGGPEGLAAELYTLIETAKSEGNHNLALKAVLAIFEAKAAIDMAQPQIELDGLSDADLEKVLREQLRRLIADDPELAIEAARGLGWQVVPY